MLEVLNAKLIEYMKAKDQLRVGVLRYLLSAVKNKEIDLRGQGIKLVDKHILKTVQKQIKQREDSIVAYKQGNRQDLVERESSELSVLKELLQLFPATE